MTNVDYVERSFKEEPMKKLYVISADLDKLQRIFDNSIESSQKYEGEQWELYHEGFGDALKMFTESIGSYKELTAYNKEEL
jgi:signal transduction histidine kinase